MQSKITLLALLNDAIRFQFGICAEKDMVANDKPCKVSDYVRMWETAIVKGDGSKVSGHLAITLNAFDLKTMDTMTTEVLEYRTDFHAE